MTKLSGAMPAQFPRSGAGRRRSIANGQGKAAQQPRNKETQSGEIGARCGGVAVRPEVSVGCDDPDKTEVRLPAMTTRSRETAATFSGAFARAGGVSEGVLVNRTNSPRSIGRLRRPMRRASTQATAIVGYLGRIAGAGSVTIDGETVARAAFDFDGFATPHGGVTGSGELRLTASHLEAVFHRIGVQLLTDDGQLLDLKFSERELPAGAEAAHVDVSGDLPRSAAEWRAASAREPKPEAHSD